MFLLFLGLKLSGEIDWSFWWVFSPIIAQVGIGVLAGALVAYVKAKKNQ